MQTFSIDSPTIVLRSKKGITLKDLTIKATDLTKNGVGVSIIGCKNVLLQRCHISGFLLGGVVIHESDDVVVEDCVFTQNGQLIIKCQTLPE
jgi:polygalacturonase